MYSLLVIFAVVLVSGCQESDESKYKIAQSLMAKGQYSEAAEKFDELGSYEEATKLSMYCKAAAAGENGDFQTSLSTFELLGDYKESQMMLTYYSARREESNSASMGIMHGSIIYVQPQSMIPLLCFRIARIERKTAEKLLTIKLF